MAPVFCVYLIRRYVVPLKDDVQEKRDTAGLD